MQWNCENIDEDDKIIYGGIDKKWSLQSGLEYMTNIYADTRQLCENTIGNVEDLFIPIVQCVGNRNDDGSYPDNQKIRPPAETQQLLCFLPLNYGADGMMFFPFVSVIDDNSDVHNEFDQLDEDEHVTESTRNYDYKEGLINFRGANGNYTEIKRYGYNAISQIMPRIKTYETL